MAAKTGLGQSQGALRFTDAQREELARLGLTSQQVRELQSRLRHVRYHLTPPAANGLVLERVQEVHKHIVKADVLVARLLAANPENTRTVRSEALGHLASGGAAILRPDLEVAGVPTAMPGYNIPDNVDVPTLLRLARVAAENALKEVPVRQSRTVVPIRAIEHILTALNRPSDDRSRAAADAMQFKLFGKAFGGVLQTVFAAASNDRPAESASLSDPKIFAEGPIRAFKKAYVFDQESRVWRRRVGRQAP